ncbi:hypothetical protein N9I26_03005 [Pseudomonadales bacterium]|nr:hypothetical protein [Pseudomonadales bacterium]
MREEFTCTRSAASGSGINYRRGTRPGRRARLIDSVTTHAGKLDVSINNAGGGPLADAAKA